jgi:hypothetical protein
VADLNYKGLDFYTTTKIRMVILGLNNQNTGNSIREGNVGINTLAPTARLHVIGQIQGNPTNTDAVASYAGTLLENIATANFNGITKKGLEIKSTGSWLGTGSSNIGLHVSTVSGGTANYDAIFNAGNNVGIGLDAPTEKLHVFNNTAPFVLLESNGGVGKTMAFKIRTWNGMAANTFIGYGSVDDGVGSGRAAIYVPDAANTGVMEALSILKSTGNVGIGTIIPGAKLEVESSTTGVNVINVQNTSATGYSSIDYLNNAGTLSYTVGFGNSTVSYPSIAYQNTYRNDLLITHFGTDPDICLKGGSGATQGFVGLGCNTPQFKLHVIGDIASSGTVRSTSAVVTGAITACSDLRYKKDVTLLSNSLDNILKLNGVRYNWKIEEFPEKHFSKLNQIGVIAQEIEKIYPELVLTDNDGYKSVDYSRLTPILIEALKEQQSEINKLKTLQLEMFQKIIKLESKIDQNENNFKAAK